MRALNGNGAAEEATAVTSASGGMASLEQLIAEAKREDAAVTEGLGVSGTGRRVLRKGCQENRKGRRVFGGRKGNLL